MHLVFEGRWIGFGYNRVDLKTRRAHNLRGILRLGLVAIVLRDR